MTSTDSTPQHPSRELLDRFRLGRLPEEVLEQIADHLENCSACKQTQPGDPSDDPLRDGPRTPLHAEPHTDEPECSRVLDALEHSLAAQLRSSRDTPQQAILTQDWRPTAPTDPFFAHLPCEFGRYRVLRRLGQGGMGAVYLCLDTRLDREVALKLPLPQPRDGSPEAERFLREARAAARLDHEGICPLLDAGEWDGTHYLTMAYIRGQPLSRLLDAGPLEPRRAADIVRSVAEALDHAHRQGVLHRDIKPANIMLDEEGQPRVIDFGLARRTHDLTVTQPGTTAGTLAYLSPERINGEPASAAADIYSLSVTLYQLLSGKLPFATAPLSQLVAQITAGEPPRPTTLRPGLDVRLEAICLKGMARAVADRYATMSEFAAALQTYGEGSTVGDAGSTTERLPPVPPAQERSSPLQASATAVPVTATAPQTGACAVADRSPARRHPWPSLAAAASVVVFAAVGGFFLFRSPRELTSFPSTPSADRGVSPTPGTSKGVPSAALMTQLVVRIWKKKDLSKALGLADAGALPLRAGDWMRVEVRSNHEAYLYVIYLDARGEASPLFPWRQYNWSDRPLEQKRQQLNLPEDPQKDGSPLQSGPSGIEAVLLLTREEPLSARGVQQLQSLFAKAPPQGKFDPLRGVVWLGKEERFGNALDRGRPNLDQSGTLVDPVERMRRLVRSDLHDMGGEVRGVCYPFQGK